MNGITPGGRGGSGAGLDSDEAARRRERYGPNAMPEAPGVPVWRRLLRQFNSPLIYILLIALAVDLTVWFMEVHTMPFEAIAIGVILALNAALGVWQEFKAEGALERLRELSAPRVWTWRDGRLAELDARELVPGDLIRIAAGDRIPADGVLRSASNLAVDESTLTGESVPVEKEPGDECFAGTAPVRGTARVEVTRTGPESALGRLATMIGALEAGTTPLERRMRAFGNRIARWILLLAAVMASAGLWAEGLARGGHVFLFAVALAVAAVPEGLPAILTVTLALGVERMARRRAVVRRLAAVESLGSVTVVLTDKTGTLTENRMDVRDLDSPDPERAVGAMIWANEADLFGGVGDPVDLALLRYADGKTGDVARRQREFAARSSRPFDAAWKYARATGTVDGQVVSYVKGAPEVVLDRCRLSPEERAAWEEKIQAYAGEGFRLLAFAWGEGERETELTWLGMALLWDPPRPEVPAAVERARSAGIRVVMLTGDHPATALTVAGSVGIPGATTTTGAEVQAASDGELRRLARHAGVFARVSPEAKLRIVEAFQAEGEVVAMTGDGVNDAPALKRADVGIAMGKRGSAVAREAADLVLLDDNFATIVAAIEEGRSIYENIQKFIRFLFSTNLSEILVVTIGSFFAYALDMRDATGALVLPLTAAQLLWINLVTDGAPALALGVDRNPGVMSRPPRDPKSRLLDRPSLHFVLASGTIKALVALSALALLPWLFRDSLEVTRTVVFLFLTAGQLMYTYPARHTYLRPKPNPFVHWAVAGSLVLQVGVATIPALMVTFHTVAIPLRNWFLVGAAVVAVYALAELTNRVIWGREGPRGAPS